MASSWGSADAQVHIANNFADRKIYVMVTTNPDWAWADVVGMVTQMIVEGAISFMSCGATLPATATKMGAAAAKLGMLARICNSIKRMTSLVQQLKIFKVAAASFDIALKGYDVYDKLGLTISTAEAMAMRTQAEDVNKSLKDYLEKTSQIIEPGASKRVNDTNYLQLLNTMNPSYWASLSGCSTVTMLIVDEHFEYVANFNTGPDDSWIVTPDCITRSKYGSIWQPDPGSGVKAWNPEPPPEPPIPMGGDCLVGLGPDNALYARAQNGSEWIKAPGSITNSIKAVSGMPDGSLLGVGSDQKLWIRPKLTDSYWVQVPNSEAVTAASAWTDGKFSAILGIGTDMKLWARWGLFSPWGSCANNTLSIKALAVLTDNRILAMGMDGKLYSKMAPNDTWVLCANASGAMSSFTGMPNGSIFGLGTDGIHRSRLTWTDPWAQMSSTATLKSVAYLYPQTMIIGVGTDNNLWTRQSLSGSWVKVENSGSVLSVTTMPDGNYVAVSTGKGLLQRPALNFPWTAISDATSVTAITAMPDGTLVGVGLNENLYTRADLTTAGAWRQVPNSGSVISVLALADGSLLGVGKDNSLWSRAKLDSAWEQIPGSTGIKSLACLRDGNICGLRLDGTLAIWENHAWQQVAGSGTMLSIFAPK